MSEHLAIGDQIKLRFAENTAAEDHVMLTLPNGLTVSYGDLVSFGDLYGVLGQPISRGKTGSERKNRFIAAFNTFAKDVKTVNESKQIIAVIHYEADVIKNAIEQGDSVEKAHASIANEVARRINCITGGGCDSATWWLDEGRLLKLMQDNYDHFKNNALLAYQAGHELAIETAIAAHDSKNEQQLRLAYAMNAYATHFISDRFAAGHIRTNRNKLPAIVTPELFGNLLAGLMHNEEGMYGLHVHNQRGDHWITYGDKTYFTKESEENKRHVEEAMQLSADEIFQAYLSGQAPEQDSLAPLLPFADENDTQNKQDISPLFYWNETTNKLMRRSDLSNPYDRHWTTSWWGWSTLIALEAIYGLPFSQQNELIQAGFGEQAVAAGIIKHPALLEAVKRKSQRNR